MPLDKISILKKKVKFYLKGNVFCIGGQSHMGYGHTPSWVYKREMAYQSISHDQETSKFLSEIEELKKENQALKARIEELEAETNNLRKYEFDSLRKD